MMKHNIADILLIVACVVTACTDNKEEPTTPTPTSTPVVEPAVEDKVPIGFSAFVEQTATTRDGEATPTPVYGAGTLINNEYTYYHGITGIGDLYNDTETGDKKGFGVFAVYTGKSEFRDPPIEAEERQIVMENERIYTTDNTGTSWKYDNERYWPGNDSHISFFAYAPYQADNAQNPEFTITKPGKTQATAGYYSYNLEDGKLKAPSIEWDLTTQKDFLYGVAYENVNDVNGVKIKNAGDDYTDMRRPNDGKLKWKLKHPLARVRFTVANYMQYDEQLSANSITLEDQGQGEVHEYDGDDTFTDKSGNVIPYQGSYVQLNDGKIYKYTKLDRRLIITDVSFVNLNKTGKLALMNEVDSNGPVWDVQTYYTGTNGDVFKLTPLNPLIGENYNNFESVFSDMLVREDQPLPLNAALKKSGDLDVPDESLEHYVLLMPQKFNNERPIQVTISYKICTYVKLGYNFDLQTRPVYKAPEGENPDPSKEYYIKRNDTFSVSGTVRFDIEANKTYNILISLGKLVNVSYELTDWDDDHEIVIPPFE